MIVLALAACQGRGPAVERTSADSGVPAAPAPPAGEAAPSRPVAPVAGTDSPASGSASPPAGGDADSAVAVLRAYYAAINARDYPRAYAAWANDGPPGHPTQAEFAKGYAATDSVQLAAGTPGPVEGAAGSRYVSVPVTLHAFERGGRRTDFVGSYTLRRAMVTGAAPESRRWHLYRATLNARVAAERDPRSR